MNASNDHGLNKHESAGSMNPYPTVDEAWEREGYVVQHPYVRCRSGHPVEPGYAVCRHVASGNFPVKIFVLATDEKLGTICCAQSPASHMAADLKIVCASCVRERGWMETT